MKKLWIVLFLFCTNSFANICVEINLPENDKYEFDDGLRIESFDGVSIAANILTPKNTTGEYPTVIFVNSWMLEEHEYLRQAVELAKKGYQVLSYSTRGWGCSEGTVDVIGPKDVKDLSIIIDWLYENTNIDKDNVGIAGISYGGGMTLMALAKEPRIKTGFAMSAWASLYEAMFHQDTARIFWSSVLMSTGAILGRVDDVLKDKFKKLVLSRGKGEVMKWANERSPIEYIEEVNKRNTPVYISNNFGDNLFQPNNVMRYFDRLTSPKILDLNQGTHASGELTGLFTVSNYTFNKLHDWFDYWLMDKKKESTLIFNRVNIQTDIEHRRESIDVKDIIKTKSEIFHLNPVKIFNGEMTKAKREFLKPIKSKISSGLDTFASTGIPLISAIIDGHFKIPVYTYMPLIDPIHGIKFLSSDLSEKLSIRGIPKLKIATNSFGKKFQMITYLYDVNKYGAAKLITHGAISGDQVDGIVDMEIVATAYDIPKGHRLALVIDTKDLLYAPNSLMPFKLEFEFSNNNTNKLIIPVN